MNILRERVRPKPSAPDVLGALVLAARNLPPDVVGALLPAYVERERAALATAEATSDESDTEQEGSDPTA